MFKRTKGYWLLTMLVLTGLAGKIHSDTLSGKERRTLARELKTTRAEFIKSIEDLSNRQLNFRPAKKQPSIKECIYQLASLENGLWITAKNCLQKETPQKVKSFSDAEVSSRVLNQSCPVSTRQLKFKNVKEAVRLYKKESTEVFKYINTSTENVRAHVVPTSLGNLDAYQLMLTTTLCTKRLTDQINQIKSQPNFPK